MYSTLRAIALIALAMAPQTALRAQFNFTIADRKVQIHSFASQGFAYSDQNNYMTMKTTQGSFAFTGGGANISAQINDKFRVGAQLYLRNIGDFGNFRPELDWALDDYKFKGGLVCGQAG
jgi:hypothetical protein